MKTNVQMYKPPDNSDKYPRIPKTLFQLRGPVINYLTSFMRLFGIAWIRVQPETVGIKALLNIDFKPMGENPPPEFMTSRKFIVRNLGEFMILFGLLYMEILPSEEEMKTIRTTWSNLIEGKMDVPSDVKLNTEEDPTATNVLFGKESNAKQTAAIDARLVLVEGIGVEPSNTDLGNASKEPLL